MSMGGLPVRRIHIGSEQLEQLRKDDVWSKRLIPVQLEIDGITVDAKLRHRGGHTRAYPKKSYELQLDDGTTLHWNAEYDDPSMIRNALSFHYFNTIGVPAPSTRHCQVEWNGQPLGIYLEIESVDRNFFDKRGIGMRSVIYAVNDSAGFGLIDPETKRRKTSLFDGYQLICGSETDKRRLMMFVRRLNLLQGERLRKHMEGKLDIKQYLTWLCGAVLTGNYDGFDQNYSLYTGTDRLYRIMPWDYEGTWGRNCYGKPCSSSLVRIQGYNTLTKKILSFPVYRGWYRRKLSHMLESSFTVEALSPAIDAMVQSIAAAIRHDRTRKWPYDVFEREPEFIRNYIRERTDVVHGELIRWRFKNRRSKASKNIHA
ncbi:CotH kinase family protein [Paenibacillus tarimensis]